VKKKWLEQKKQSIGDHKTLLQSFTFAMPTIRDFGFAFRELRDLRRIGVKLDEHAYGAVFQTAPDRQTALMVLQEMNAHKDVQLGAYTYNSLLEVVDRSDLSMDEMITMYKARQTQTKSDKKLKMRSGHG
jgi:hypothetical protein